MASKSHDEMEIDTQSSPPTSTVETRRSIQTFPIPDSQPASVTNVLGTTELLELMLSFLPLPSLLRVQAVSQSWRDLIKDSTLLQQKLFLKAEKVDKIWLADISNLPSQPTQPHPLPRRYLSTTRVLAEVHPNDEVLKTFHGLIATPVKINELFLRFDPFLKDPDDIDYKIDRGYVAEYSAPLDFLQTIEQHSMRDMLLTQPPVTHLCVEVLAKRLPHEDIAVGLTFRQSGNYGLYAAKLIEPGGVRVHQVAEALEKLQMLDRAESIKIFMVGVVEGTEEHHAEARRRGENWRRDRMQI